MKKIYDGDRVPLNGSERARCLSKLCSLIDFSSLHGPYMGHPREDRYQNGPISGFI